MPIPKPLNDITEADLLALINAGVAEGRTIEYKRELLLGDDKQKRKLVISIASFANASGGDLIFGMEAKDGVPKRIAALAGFNVDKDTLTIRDIIRHHVDPPIHGIEYREVLVSGGATLVVRVPRSWTRPHMVTYGGENRFHTRDSNGCVAMNVPEIRAAFLGAKTEIQKLQSFRLDRLSSIRSGELPFRLMKGSKAVLHLLPIASFQPGFAADVNSLSDTDLRPMVVASGWSTTHDLDGRYSFDKTQDGECLGYLFVSRSGCIEIVNCTILNRGRDNVAIIPNPYFESEFIEFLPQPLACVQKMQVEYPIAIGLTLFDVQGHQLSCGPMSRMLFARPVSYRDLLISEAVVDDPRTAPPKILKPLFDSLWNACGLQRSLNYDDKGEWKPRAWR
jgi:hypothetical protein